jgi:hypothetical protein
MTFPTPHIGHSSHGLFFTRWIVNPMLNLLKRTMTYPGFEPGTFGLAVSIANHYTSRTSIHAHAANRSSGHQYTFESPTQHKCDKSAHPHKCENGNTMKTSIFDINKSGPRRHSSNGRFLTTRFHKLCSFTER